LNLSISFILWEFKYNSPETDKLSDINLPDKKFRSVVLPEPIKLLFFSI
jgi:hypothetical protein